MKRIRSDFGKRFQYEAPLVHRWVRDCQAGIVDDRVAKQQNVDVDDARALFLLSSPP
jgi:hypothetical protein